MSHAVAGPKERELRFKGSSRADAKRKALNYWYVNQRALRLSIKEYSERLTLLPDGRTITFSFKPKR